MGHSDLPLASGERHAKAFERCGWIRLARRGRGSHILLSRPGVPVTLSIPDHREVKRAVIAKLLKAAGVDEREYLDAFR